jgi:hypothetical protein
VFVQNRLRRDLDFFTARACFGMTTSDVSAQNKKPPCFQLDNAREGCAWIDSLLGKFANSDGNMILVQKLFLIV